MKLYIVFFFGQNKRQRPLNLNMHSPSDYDYNIFLRYIHCKPSRNSWKTTTSWRWASYRWTMPTIWHVTMAYALPVRWTSGIWHGILVINPKVLRKWRCSICTSQWTRTGVSAARTGKEPLWRHDRLTMPPRMHWSPWNCIGISLGIGK